MRVRKLRWINYFSIKNVSYPAKAKRDLRWYMSLKLSRYYKRKSQRQCRLYKQGSFEVLVKRYSLINPVNYSGVTTC